MSYFRSIFIRGLDPPCTQIDILYNRIFVEPVPAGRAFVSPENTKRNVSAVKCVKQKVTWNRRK